MNNGTGYVTFRNLDDAERFIAVAGQGTFDKRKTRRIFVVVVDVLSFSLSPPSYAFRFLRATDSSITFCTFCRFQQAGCASGRRW